MVFRTERHARIFKSAASSSRDFSLVFFFRLLFGAVDLCRCRFESVVVVVVVFVFVAVLPALSKASPVSLRISLYLSLFCLLFFSCFYFSRVTFVFRVWFACFLASRLSITLFFLFTCRPFGLFPWQSLPGFYTTAARLSTDLTPCLCTYSSRFDLLYPPLPVPNSTSLFLCVRSTEST